MSTPDRRELTNALLELLRTAAAPKGVGDMGAPANTDEPGAYAVLEQPPGSQLEASLAGESYGTFRYRIRCVSHTPGTARDEVEWLRKVLTDTLLDRSVPIAGATWSVGGRTHEPDAGLMWEGTTVNSIDDFALYAGG